MCVHVICMYVYLHVCMYIVHMHICSAQFNLHTSRKRVRVNPSLKIYKRYTCMHIHMVVTRCLRNCALCICTCTLYTYISMYILLIYKDAARGLYTCTHLASTRCSVGMLARAFVCMCVHNTCIHACTRLQVYAHPNKHATHACVFILYTHCPSAYSPVVTVCVCAWIYACTLHVFMF